MFFFFFFVLLVSAAVAMLLSPSRLFSVCLFVFFSFKEWTLVARERSSGDEKREKKKR
jgi:hypothetical protein